MEILITGATGGIGSAIGERLKDHNLTRISHATIETNEEFDWMICAHGVINEQELLSTFYANVLSNIYLAESIKANDIIFISSTSGIKGNDKFPIYSASKAALNMYAKLKGCYVICPGPTDTKMWRKLGLEGETQSPDEVARVVEQIVNGMYPKGSLIKIKNGVCELLT